MLYAVVINLFATFLLGLYVYMSEEKAVYDDAELRSKLRQLDADLDDVFDRLKRMTSRKGMQAKRDENAANPYRKLPTETDGEWKARARKLRQNGVAPNEGD